MTQSVEQNFFKELAEYRMHASRLNPEAVARLAISHGFPACEALKYARGESPFHSPRNSEIFGALTTFVSALTNKLASNVLEYTGRLALLSEQLIGQPEFTVTISSSDLDVQNVVKLILGENVVTATEVGEMAKRQTFGCVICQPPIGHKSGHKNADGFGGEIVAELEPLVSVEGSLLWLTNRGVLNRPAAQKTIASLERKNLFVNAVIDIPAGAFQSDSVEGALIVLSRNPHSEKLVGALREEEAATAMAFALRARGKKHRGGTWEWVERQKNISYSDIENAAILERLLPKGRHELKMLNDLLADAEIKKVDTAHGEYGESGRFIFIPEYAGSRVATDLESLSVKPKATYQLTLDVSQVNPRFLAMLMNSPYGRKLRESSSQGVTIPRLSVSSLRSLALPLPDLPTQERIVGIESDIELLASSLREMQERISSDWTHLAEVGRDVGNLKGVLDIERRIENWWQELPYPLATIYRRFQVEPSSKERLDYLLHFFEIAAVYLAAIGTSYVRVLRADWRQSFSKWLHPSGCAGIERADFGFWIKLAGASLKDIGRITSDKKLRDAAVDHAGPGLVESSSRLGRLSKASLILDKARIIRNDWKGHGGHLKESDAERLAGELNQSIRDLYSATSNLFQQFLLVKPGLMEMDDDGFVVRIQKLVGSDPAFESDVVELKGAIKSGSLAFWVVGSAEMCRALPFFRLGAPTEPQETSFYVLNRVENEGFRWISYQEASEQEFVAPDQDLLKLIDLSKVTKKR